MLFNPTDLYLAYIDKIMNKRQCYAIVYLVIIQEHTNLGCSSTASFHSGICNPPNID